MTIDGKARHVHTAACYAKDVFGQLVCKGPIRPDGLDTNLRTLNILDFKAGLGHAGLTLICKEG